MPQMYTIYVKENEIRIHDGSTATNDCIKLSDSKEDTAKLLSAINKMLASTEGGERQCLQIISNDSKKYLKNLKHAVQYIKAAGGLVKNDLKQYLFIFRLGKWDLPKGKLEDEEKPEEAAIREVEEECSIKIQLVKKELESTYHIYEQDGKVVLKRTCWYLMKCNDLKVPIPQLEEGITEVRWFKISELDEVRQNTFPSVLDVMKNISG